MTTAVTDLLLGLVSLISALQIIRAGVADPWRARLWALLFVLLAVASTIGSFIHGAAISDGLRILLWQPVFLILGLVVGLFIVAAILDWMGIWAARRMFPFVLVTAFVFYAGTRLVERGFVLFLVYEAAAMLLALGIYVGLARRRVLGGAWFLVGGICLNLVAAAVQASPAAVQLIWSFNHTGLFHLIQILAVIVLTLGVRRGFVAPGAA